MAEKGAATAKEETKEVKDSTTTKAADAAVDSKKEEKAEGGKSKDMKVEVRGEGENEWTARKLSSYHKQARSRGARRHTPYQQRNRAVYHQRKEADSDPSCRVYVGNLSWDVTWRELKDHMKTTGFEVTRADVLASPDGRSKGCGIVEFADAEGAKTAVENLNNTELMGRAIFVREDREESSSSGYYTQQTGQGGGAPPPAPRFNSGGDGDAQTRRVYVGNLSWDVAWQDLKDHMRQAGDVIFAEVMNESDGRSKGCGIVEYATAEEAKEAIATLTDSELKGRMIFVREDRETSGAVTTSFPSPPSAVVKSGGFTSVYVGNLSYETSWQDLKDHMRQAGNVDQANILSNDDGRSKGCGTVQYQRSQDAARAIRELQNSVLHGRPIFIREDREQGGGGGARRGGGGGKPQGGGSQLFVGNLSSETTWRDLKDYFRTCGDVERAEVVRGKKGSFGTVRFFNEKDAQNAIETLDGSELHGNDIEVRNDYRAN